MNQIYSAWGLEHRLDLCNCDHDSVKSIEKVTEYLKTLPGKIDMICYGEARVYRFGENSLEGVSGMQFIMTSSITIHCDEVGNEAMINVFSCKEFDPEIVREYSKKMFGGEVGWEDLTTRGHSKEAKKEIAASIYETIY